MSVWRGRASGRFQQERAFASRGQAFEDEGLPTGLVLSSVGRGCCCLGPWNFKRWTRGGGEVFEGERITREKPLQG